MAEDNSLLWVGLAILGAIALSAGGVAVAEYWMSSQEAQKWAPALAAAEKQYGLPAGLLSRQAYEESAFRSSVIDGTTASSAGALGILQLEPAYFSSVQVPTPFTDADVLAQIDQAAQYDASLHQEFGSWSLALAAYNWGPGALQASINAGESSTSWPQQTQNYVAQITKDVPAAQNA